MRASDYRARAEEFATEIGLEHYRHFAGLQESFEIEAIYERHADLFTRAAVDSLRDAGAGDGGAGGASRELLQFAVQGHLGRETAALDAEVARREAALEVTLGEGEDERRIPFRQAPVVQANTADAGERAAIHAARLELTERELTPLLRESHETTAALARDLGYESVLDMCEELSGVALRALGEQTAEVLDATAAVYEPSVESQLREHLGLGFGELRASDLPAFFRAPALDTGFPADRLLPALAATAAGLGMPLDRLPGVELDVEERRTKSPRAFCSPVRVPDEVYLVIAPTGGRDDYATILHEAGHALHYAHVEPAHPFEHRYLGDNAITETYAFLLQYLSADPGWLRRRLDVPEPEPVAAHARAEKLVFVRRYCAKLGYELELHARDADLESMPERYADALSEGVRVDWPRASWLSDVDAFFYAGAYLRAWAMEAHLRRHLVERFGEAWFEQPEAGALLRRLWSEGQSRPPDELLAEATGRRLDFSALLADVGAAAPAA